MDGYIPDSSRRKSQYGRPSMAGSTARNDRSNKSNHARWVGPNCGPKCIWSPAGCRAADMCMRRRVSYE